MGVLTTRFGFQAIDTGHIRPTVPINNNYSVLDMLLCSAVENETTGTPPGSPSNGDTYRIATGTGSWLGYDGCMAYWANGWLIVVPPIGFTFYNKSTTKMAVFTVKPIPGSSSGTTRTWSTV